MPTGDHLLAELILGSGQVAAGRTSDCVSDVSACECTVRS